MYKYFKAKEKLRKIFNYFSIFTIIFGTTFGSINSAYAENVGDGVTDDDATATDYDFNTAAKDLTITTDTGTPPVTNIAVGNITDTAITGDVIITTRAADATAPTFVIGSIDLDAGTAPGVVTITDVDGSDGDMTVTVSGVFDIDGALTVTTLEATNSETITVNFDGATTVALATEIDADSAAGTGSINIKVSAGATFTGGVDLGDIAGTTTATLTLDGTAAQAIAGAIDGEEAGEGIVAVTNTAGAVTFSGALGGSAALRAVTIGTSTDDSDAIFSATVAATTITVQAGDATTGEDSTAKFDAAVTGALVLAPNGGSASVDFIDESIITALTGAITTTSTDGDDSTVNIYDDGGGAPALQTFTGQIGTSTNKIGTLAIGQANGFAGKANFDSDIYITNLTITGDDGTDESSLASFDASIIATTITLDDDTGTATLELATASAESVSGTIDGAGDNEGTLKVSAATKTFTGAIGSTYDLLMVDIDDTAVFNSSVATKGLNIATAKTATFLGDVTIGSDGATLVGAAGEMILDAAGDQTVTGTIVGGSAEEGVIDNANTDGTVTFASALGGTELKEVELDASSITVFNSTVKSALIDIAGKATFKENGNVANNLTLASGGTIIIDDTVVTTEEVFTVGTGFVDGSIAGTGNIKMPANLLDGEYLILIAQTTDAADAAIVVDVEAAVFDTALRTYTASAVANGANDNDIKVTAADRAASDVASNLGTTTNMGSALIKAAIAVENDSAALDAFSNALNAEGGYSATEDTALAKQVAPQDDMISGSTVATRAMTGTVQGIMSSRMASLRSGDAYFGAGMSAGSMMSANSGFIQAFGSEAEQKNKRVGSGTQYGYDSQSSGVAIGFDGINDNGVVVGLSLSMSETDVDGKGTGKAKNDIDSYTASLYMDKATDNGYIEGSLTVGLNENNSSRLVNTAGLSRTYKGSYDSQQVSLKIGGGVPNSVGNNGYVTPFGSITGTIIETDAYTETSTTSSDSLRLRVAQDDVSSVVGTVGVKYHNVLSNGGVPMISLAINNEFGDDTINSTNTYQGGGTSFTTSTAVEELSATLGLGFSMGNDVSSVEFAYEANVNDDDYLGHYGSFKIVTKF